MGCQHCNKLKYTKRPSNKTNKHGCAGGLISCTVGGTFGTLALKKTQTKCDIHKYKHIKACLFFYEDYKNEIDEKPDNQIEEIDEEQGKQKKNQDDDVEMKENIKRMTVQRIPFDDTSDFHFERLASKHLEKNNTFNCRVMSQTLLPNQTIQE